MTWIGSTAKNPAKLRSQQCPCSKTPSRGQSSEELAVARTKQRRALRADLVEIDPRNASPTCSDDVIGSLLWWVEGVTTQVEASPT